MFMCVVNVVYRLIIVGNKVALLLIVSTPSQYFNAHVYYDLKMTWREFMWYIDIAFPEFPQLFHILIFSSVRALKMFLL